MEKFRLHRQATCEPIPVNMEEPLKNELTHFIECVQQRKRPKTDGDEGLKVLKILESAEKSLLEGEDIPKLKGKL